MDFPNISLTNKISVITLDDNLEHNYLINMEWTKDNNLPVGYTYFTTLYQKEILQYWMTYKGIVIVNAQLIEKDKEIKKQKAANNLPNSSLQSTAIQKINQNEYYNYSFIGRVNRAKQVGQSVQVHLEDVGWKFLQKVPHEFRQSYIAGQSLGDAFQAMCEFMGVDFAYSIEDLDKYKFSADGYSIEKDGTIIEEVQTVFEEWSNAKNEDEEMAKALTDIGNEFSGVIDAKKAASIISDVASALNPKITNTTPNAISTTDNNVDDTTNNLQDDKIEKYQEEFDEKIKNLFIGNTLYDSNVTDPVLNYGAITIQPQAISNNVDMSVENTNDTLTENNNNTSQDDEKTEAE